MATRGLKLGIVHLGRVCGKHKYMLIDVIDIPFVRKFCFQASLELDKDGNNAKVFAFAYTPIESSTLHPPGHPNGASGLSERGIQTLNAVLAATARHFIDKEADDLNEGHFHELLWKHRVGPIPHNYHIIHKNGISVDNRLSNLELAPITHVDGDFSHLDASDVDRRQNEANLYRAALAQLPPFPEDDIANATGGLVALADDTVDSDSPPPLAQVLPYAPGVSLVDMASSTRAQTQPAAMHRSPAPNPIVQVTVPSSAFYAPFDYLTQAVGMPWGKNVVFAPTVLNGNGDQYQQTPSTDLGLLYECHHSPCCKLEAFLRQFHVCSRCHSARYCSARCQSVDWKNHKRECKKYLDEISHSDDVLYDEIVQYIPDRFALR